MKKTTILIIFTVMLLSVTALSALAATDSHGKAFPNPVSSGTMRAGARIVPMCGNITIKEIGFDTGVTDTVAYIENETHILYTAPISGYKAVFDYPLINGTTYYFLSSAAGNASHGGRYTAPGGMPANTTCISWTGGIFSDAATQRTVGPTIIVNVANVTYNMTVASSDPVRIILVNQTPANITSINLIPNGGNQTYSFNTTNLVFGKVYLNLTITTGNACLQFYNGTCRIANNTNQVVNPSANVNDTGTTNYTFSLGENNVYPSSENLNFTQIGLGTYKRILTQENDYVADTILNISANAGSNFYEVPVLSTGVVRVYYFNSSYDFSSNPNTNSNVHEFCVLNNPTTYNHTHNQSGHQLCPYIVNDTGFLGTVKVSNGGFIIRGNTQGVNITVANITARPNVAQVSTNGGATWSSLTGTVASHLHQFTANTQVCTQAFGNYTSTFYNSTRTCEVIDEYIFPPESPTVYTPNSTSYERLINITWEQSIPYAISRYITGYNVTLRNSDFSFNATLNTSNNMSRSYYWDTYTMNLTVGTQYHIGVEASDNAGAKSLAFSENFTVSSNGFINVTAKDGVTGTSIANFSVNAYSATAGVNVTRTANGTSDVLPITKGYNYTLTIDAATYALQNATVFAANATTNYQFNMSPTNSVYVYVFDQSTGLSLNTVNTTVTFQSGIYYLNSTSGTGAHLFQNLTTGNWTVVVSSSGYASSTYYVQVTDRSTQTLNAYLAQSVVNVIFTNKDSVTGDPLSGAVFTIQNQVGPNWVTVGQTTTDAFGQAVFSLLPVHEYQFIISANGYFTKTGIVNTVITSYTVLLNANNTQQFTTYSQDFTYALTPSSVSANSTTFSITTSSPQGALQWFAVVVNNNGTVSMQNVTGSPSGGTASITIDFTNLTGGRTVTAKYYVHSINIDDTMVIGRSWFLYGSAGGGNYTFVDFMEYYGGASSPLDMTSRGVIVTITAVVLAAGTGLMVGAAPAIMIAAMVFLVAGVFGWLGIGLTVITVGGLIGVLVMGGRQ